jgi:Asp-tRNA(Asn)/Glu-tRNA(Gln) amidotransferase A subunit family amidase
MREYRMLTSEDTDPIKAAADRFLSWVRNPGDVHGAYASISVSTVDEEAARLSSLWRARPDMLPLAGLTISVKDNVCTELFPTYMGSRKWVDRGGFDARVVATIRDKGGLIVGKTKTAEFAVHDAPDTSNPHHPTRQVGTSSSGSAVAVVTDSCDVSLATQTAGSISRPASFVGVRCIKPTMGLLPRTGILKTSDDFDTVGLMGRSYRGIERVLRHSIPDISNHPIIRAGFSSPRKLTSTFLVPTRLGQELMPSSLSREVVDFLERQTLGKYTITAFDIPNGLLSDTREAHELIYAWGVYYYLGEELAEESRDLRILPLFLRGATVSPSELETARRVIRDWTKWANEALDGAILAEPATAGGAPELDGGRELPDNNLLWTAAGVPTIGLPVLATDDGLPVSIQLVGQRFSDFNLLSIGESMDPSP